MVYIDLRFINIFSLRYTLYSGAIMTKILIIAYNIFHSFITLSLPQPQSKPIPIRIHTHYNHSSRRI